MEFYECNPTYRSDKTTKKELELLKDEDEALEREIQAHQAPVILDLSYRDFHTVFMIQFSPGRGSKERNE